MRFTNVFYAPSLARNIFRYEKLGKKGYAFTYTSGKRDVPNRSDEHIVFDFAIGDSVLVVNTGVMAARTKEPVHVIMSALQKDLGMTHHWWYTASRC